jgi:hypothetical protein
MIGCPLFIDDLKEVGGLSVGRFGHPPPLSDLTPYKFIVKLESLRQGNNTPQISLNIVENITM